MNPNRKRLPEAAGQCSFVNELPPRVVHIVNGERVEPGKKLAPEEISELSKVLTYVVVKVFADVLQIR